MATILLAGVDLFFRGKLEALLHEHHLITTGPYAWVRHPIYSAMLGYGIALALVTANAVFYAAMLEKKLTPIKARLGTIPPRSAAEAVEDELP